MDAVAEREAKSNKKTKPRTTKDPVKVDLDPTGALLLAKPALDEAWRWVSLLQQYAPYDVATHVAAFDVAFEQQKYLLCLQAMLAAIKVSSSSSSHWPYAPPLLKRLVLLYHVAARSSSSSSSPTSGHVHASIIQKLFQEARAELFHGAKDVREAVEQVKVALVQQKASSRSKASLPTTATTTSVIWNASLETSLELEWRIAVAESAALLDRAKSKHWIGTWLFDGCKETPSPSLETALQALAVIRRIFDPMDVEAWVSKVQPLYPYAATTVWRDPI
jgi:hypothetical protein